MPEIEIDNKHVADDFYYYRLPNSPTTQFKVPIPRKQLQHKVVTGTDTYKLSAEIERCLSEGWQLHGNLCTTNLAGYSVNYSQSMTKEVEVAPMEH